MSWRLIFRPEVEEDVSAAAEWYESREFGLGVEFIDEVKRAWDFIAQNPFLNSRRHARRNIRWCYPQRFPYRIIYEIQEGGNTVVVLAVLHAARHDRHWKQRR